MSWIEIIGGVELQCTRYFKGKDEKFKYEQLKDDDSVILFHSSQSPTASRDLNSWLKKHLERYIGESEDLYGSVDEAIVQIKNTLEKNILDEGEQANNEAYLQESEYQKKLDEKYTDLYSSFNSYCEKYGLSPLGLIVSVTHCLGVGSSREIVRAFLGYFQTAAGFKGTNVIAVGNATSGKSFTLETALSMLPQELISYGVKSVAYFFRKYAGQDLTGRIFYLGDLGGDNDNQNTIEFRDKIKQLSTDGHVERGIIDTNDNMEEMDQSVEGYPCLSYTTALEETLNEQEKSRSTVLTPAPLDAGRLMVYNTLQEANGVFREDMDEINSVRDSIQGLVKKFNPDRFELFNPYQFCIQPLIEDSDDFNRKISEFEAVLKLVCVLDKPERIHHQLYVDENYEPQDTQIILASKRDNINALNVFDSSNLLPDEIRFADGIIENYKSFDEEYILDEDNIFEDEVLSVLKNDYTDNNGNNYAIDDDGRLNILFEDLREYWFTLRTLRQDHRHKAWFKKSKNYINDRIKKLVDEGIIIVLGKDSKNPNHNVYILNRGIGDSVSDKIPQFKASEINKATKLFELIFPEQLEEYKTFLENDKGNVETASIFEVVKPLIPYLPYLEDEFNSFMK